MRLVGACTWIAAPPPRRLWCIKAGARICIIGIAISEYSSELSFLLGQLVSWHFSVPANLGHLSILAGLE